MNNTEKKLDALIDALGFDVGEDEAFHQIQYAHALMSNGNAKKEDYIFTNYKFTKRDKGMVDAAARDIARGIDPRSSRSNLQSLMTGLADETPRSAYTYMREIKELVMKSGIPKSIVLDLVRGLPDE